MMRNQTHVVSGIHLVVHDIENPIMYTTSMDATIVVKKIEIKKTRSEKKERRKRRKKRKRREKR